jgi:hypothetical protein
MYHPPEEGNLCDEYGNALKPATVQIKSTTNTWGMWTRVTACGTATPSADGHGNGPKKNSSFTY